MNGAAAGSAGAAGAAAAAAIAEAIKASGAIVRVTPEDFHALVSRTEKPLVVTAEGGFFSKNYQYLMGCRGLVFFTKSPLPLDLPPGTDTITAKKIWIPG